MSLLESYKISDEEFNNKFSDWLFEKSITDFSILNGYSILRSFIKQYIGKDLLMDFSDYRYFIQDRRDLIKIIQLWISTFNLSFDDYKIFFENYCKIFLEENSINLKTPFTKVFQSFQDEVINANFIIEKADILIIDLQYIFINSINKKEVRAVAEKNAVKEELKKAIKDKKMADKIKAIAVKEELNSAIKDKKMADKIKAIAVKKELKPRRLFCQNCNIRLNNDNTSYSRKFGVFCEGCFKKHKKETKLKYHQKFPEKVKANRNSYKKRRIERDIPFKILQRLRSRILLVLHGKKKLMSSLNLLGCSPEHLRIHLESQFKEGMTWDNYGIKGWHIDHIVPCASFDFTLIEDQKKCFHYSNLQPLWWLENVIKSDRIL